MTDISGELAKRISRRQFLFGGRNSGGGGSEAGVLGTVLGAAGLGVGVMALGSPGPNAQSFQDAYVRKGGDTMTGDLLAPNVTGTNSLRTPTFVAQGPSGDAAFVNAEDSVDFPGSTRIAFGSGTDDRAGGQGQPFAAPGTSFDWLGEIQRNIVLPTQVHDYFATDPTLGRELFIDTASVLGRIDRLAWREDTTPGNLRRAVATDELDQTTTGLLSVGPPTATAGTTNRFADQGHRHGFTGRFHVSGYLAAALGAGFPLNFKIVQTAFNWTLRRLVVKVQTGPVGGTETYALVNAAGVVQGTALVLAAGALEAIGALQVTNLVVSTKYYLAQTAVGAGWTAGSTGIDLDAEYTM